MYNYKQEIGERLRSIRKEKNLTQEQVSEMIGISQKHYSEVERGITGLSVKHLIVISECLSVSLDYLMKGTVSEPLPKNIKQNINLNALYFDSSSYTQEQMLKLVQIAHDIDAHSKNKNKN